MKWVLISGIGGNPGDGFIRLGVEELIRTVDPDASIRGLDRVCLAVSQPWFLEYDRAVVCGMPFFYSHQKSAIWSERYYQGVKLFASRPRDLMFAGVGSFTPWRAPLDVAEPEKLKTVARDLDRDSHTIYVRDHVANEVTGMGWPVSVCPSVWVMRSRKHDPRYKFCTLMRDGGYQRRFGEDESRHWRKNLYQQASKILMKAAFYFVAHSEAEVQRAQDDLDWPRHRILSFSRDPHQMADIYAMCGQYFGNRVHGAVPARAVGGDAWLTGFDSRMEAAILAGARATLPSEVDLKELADWANQPVEFHEKPRYKEAWEFQVELFRGFAGQRSLQGGLGI